jgi:hypothetical protein
MAKTKYDFGGYATKVDLKCSDGRTIRRDAFAENDGQTVPLVWQHIHNDPGNVLGHALLENRKDGVYAYCIFNSTEAGKNAKSLVEHGDIKNLSIYANELQQKGNNVLHGTIREVSLVLAGANPGALIDNLDIQHSDGSFETDDTEAIIYTNEKISLKDLVHEDSSGKKVDEDEDEDGELNHADLGDDATVQEVFDSLNDQQKEVVYAMISHALGQDGGNGDEIKKVEHSAKGGKEMKKNIFDYKATDDKLKNVLTHAQFDVILADAQKMGSLKNAILAHATEYGIENIDILFPDAQNLTKDPQWIQRETGWVSGVLAAIHHSPFSRIKSVFFDMDFDTARAKGYVKATEKKETYFKASKRVTTPTTIYVSRNLTETT